jgi:hypothetical protein
MKQISASAFFPAQLLLELHRNGAKIKDFDVRHFPRMFGKESGGRIDVVLSTIKDLITYYSTFRSSKVVNKD